MNRGYFWPTSSAPAEGWMWRVVLTLNRTVTSFVKDVLRLPPWTNQNATEARKVHFLLNGVTEDIFNTMVWDPCVTISDIIVVTTWTKCVTSLRIHDFQQLPRMNSHTKHCLGGVTKASPTSGCLCDVLIFSEIIREEVEQAIRDAPSFLVSL